MQENIVPPTPPEEQPRFSPEETHEEKPKRSDLFSSILSSLNPKPKENPAASAPREKSFIDLSKGLFKGSRPSLEKHLKTELFKVIPQNTPRHELIKDLIEMKSGYLSKKAAKTILDRHVSEGKITKFKALEVKKRLGI